MPDAPAPLLFRWHRGGFDESLATAVELANLSDPLGSLVESLRGGLGDSFLRGDVSVRPYAPDPRHADWGDTHLVTVCGAAVGYTSAPIATPRDAFEDGKDVLSRYGETHALGTLRYTDEVLLIEGDVQTGSVTVSKRSSNWAVVVLETDRQTHEPRFAPDAFLVPLSHRRRSGDDAAGELPRWLVQLRALAESVRGEGTVGKAP